MGTGRESHVITGGHRGEGMKWYSEQWTSACQGKTSQTLSHIATATPRHHTMACDANLWVFVWNKTIECRFYAIPGLGQIFEVRAERNRIPGKHFIASRACLISLAVFVCFPVVRAPCAPVSHVLDPGGLITLRNAACSAWRAATGKQFILTLSKNIPGPAGRTSAQER